ncbi:hypothetical protein [Pontibacillus yanchengensis]|uniref:ABC transmembrane type-1 domain-containing protein n=1 Tax=Pontibacillus yanchengensis Y32 TaxID=1385514 RepID=A0A0A2T926_9BACI|nr:hypothetical protein [Pontibacillus yanchengensis]KGP70893.1 hypothetical protein N782_21530 [Pontibacillus yanchengensis Y32]
MKLLKLIVFYIIGLVGILLVSSVPVLFEGGVHLNIMTYLNTLGSIIAQLSNPSEWVINSYQKVKPLIPFMSEGYIYSMTVLLSALVIAVIVGFTFAFATMLLPKVIQESIKKWLNFIQAFPDVIFIFLLQMFVVWAYQTFDFLIFEFVYLGEDKIYFAPILTLSILPTVLFYKVCLLLLEEEWSKDYVGLAKSKGIRNLFILSRHCIQNIGVSLFYQSKSIVWMSLSSLMIIEYLFNFFGIFRIVTMDPRPFIIFMALSLIFTPFFFLYTGMEMIMTGGKRDSNHGHRLFRNLNTFGGWYKGERLQTVIKGRIIAFIQYNKKLWKRVPFVLGMTYIIGFTIISFAYTWSKEKPIREVKFYNDENGNLVSVPPHDPTEPFFFGSDAYGYAIMDQIIVGAKYTILTALCIALLRVLLSYLLTIPFLFWMGEKSQRVISKLSDGIQYLPLSLLAYVMLRGVLLKSSSSDWPISFSERIIFEVILLTILVIPVVLNIIGNEAKRMLDEEYIYQSIMMGASKAHVFFQQITPQLFPKLVNQFAQQLIQVLYIFIHLGVFELLLGGTIINVGGPPTSVTNEWAGMIAYLREAFMTEKLWLIAPSLIAYILFILSVQGIAGAMINEAQEKIGVVKRKHRRKKKKSKKRFNPELMNDPSWFVQKNTHDERM